MFRFKKLSLASAITASLIAANAAQAHVSYDYTTATGGEPPASNTAHATASWTLGSWTGGSPLAKGYTGNLPATWLANIHDTGVVYEISKANAIEEGDPDGAGPDPSVISSSFKLESVNNKWNPLHSWGNALDFGLIDLQVDGNVTITVQAEADSLFTPGFTLWQGWDATASSSKHGPWNVNPIAPTARGSNNLTYIGHASTTSSNGGVNYSFDNVSMAVAITFNGLSAGQYSLWIGGNATGTGICGASCTTNGSTGTTNQQYSASISVAPVPIPAAVWLFGSAFAGMIGIGRRKTATSV